MTVPANPIQCAYCGCVGGTHAIWCGKPTEEQPMPKDLYDTLLKLQEQLAWLGPGGRQLGHVVLSRQDAETLVNYLLALQERRVL